jgi:CO/xanthine dehydrogenase Mo-binding subunit
LTIHDGRIREERSGRETSYWELADESLLAQDATGRTAPRDPRAHKVVGTSTPRLDIPDKVLGVPRFIHDLLLPEMAYGRVIRPPRREAILGDADLSPIAASPGIVRIVRDGSFLGVVADREEIAVETAEAVRASVSWRGGQTLPDANRLCEFLLDQPAETTVVDERIGGSYHTIPARTVSAVYSRPYLAHASLGPSCGVALWSEDRLQVWSHTQNAYSLRRDLALAFAVSTEHVLVRHVEGAGCYGHNAADDAAFDAALLAREVPGRPVKVVWSRADELGWAPFGPAMVVRVAADLDAAGDVMRWQHEIWSNGHLTRPGLFDVPALLAMSHLDAPGSPPIAVDPPWATGGGAERNSVPLYEFPAHRVIKNRLLSMPLRTSALRSLGAHTNVFAVESFIDELAAENGVDPADYRLRLLTDLRARAVIAAVVKRSGWRDRIPESGHGLAFARHKTDGSYCAVVAKVDADHTLAVRELTIVVDAGQVVNPDGLVNQIEGGAIQSVSWTTKEAVVFDRATVTSSNWETYPILRFSEVPVVNVEVLDRPGEPSLGVGETCQGPVAAAVANALFDATGIRVRDLPLTHKNIEAAVNR